MIYILLEALLAGLIFVLIVWWTMFSGRVEPSAEDEAAVNSTSEPDALDDSTQAKANTPS